MQEILDAILNDASGPELAELPLPETFRAATVHKDDVELFAFRPFGGRVLLVVIALRHRQYRSGRAAERCLQTAQAVAARAVAAESGGPPTLRKLGMRDSSFPPIFFLSVFFVVMAKSC